MNGGDESYVARGLKAALDRLKEMLGHTWAVANY